VFDCDAPNRGRVAVLRVLQGSGAQMDGGWWAVPPACGMLTVGRAFRARRRVLRAAMPFEMHDVCLHAPMIDASRTKLWPHKFYICDLRELVPVLFLMSNACV
jgi:hypothetical protein